MTSLKLVGVEERVHHLPKQLSGGQEQRVAIARAIVSDPTLILADEPTGDLDRASAAQVLDLVRRVGGKLLREATVFDVYEGDQVPPGKRSLAVIDDSPATRSPPCSSACRVTLCSVAGKTRPAWRWPGGRTTICWRDSGTTNMASTERRRTASSRRAAPKSATIAIRASAARLHRRIGRQPEQAAAARRLDADVRTEGAAPD